MRHHNQQSSYPSFPLVGLEVLEEVVPVPNVHLGMVINALGNAVRARLSAAVHVAMGRHTKHAIVTVEIWKTARARIFRTFRK